MLDSREKLSAKLEIYVENLFDALGFDLSNYVLTESSIRGVSMCHKDADNPTAFVYYYDRGSWHCWTNQCHRIHGWDLVGLIMAINKCNYGEAIKFAANVLDGKNIPDSSLRQKPIRENKDYWNKHLNQHSYDVKCLESLSNADSYARGRGLSPKEFHEIGIGYAKKNRMRKRIVVPIRNVNNNIVGFSGRRINDDTDSPKWLHHGIKKSINLFNIERAFSHIGFGCAILVEGPFDSIKLTMAGFKNSVAILGTHISSGQIEILNRCNVVKVCLALDNDKAGNSAINSNVQILKRKLFSVSKVEAPKNMDFGDMSIGDIKIAMKEEINI